MIIGVGLDITDCERIRRARERFGAAFDRRVLGSAGSTDVTDLDVARSFAAGEALVKALRSAWFRLPPGERRLRRVDGAWQLDLSGATANAVLKLGAGRVHVDVAESSRRVAAVVILERLSS